LRTFGVRWLTQPQRHKRRGGRHADVKITLKIHSHTNLESTRQALGMLDGRLS
jgi:hypothetical protein